MKIVVKFIRFLIEKIESFEYRNLNLDEDDISKKIIFSQKLNGIKISTDTGFEEVSDIHITQPYKIWEIELENGYKLKCADNHIVFDNNLNEVFVKDLNIDDIIKTDEGNKRVISIKKSNRKSSMGDLTVNSENHRYYTNGILSHNTITSSIFILHYLLFNQDKNVLIAANIGDTALEIMDKVKLIYQGLPFFIQQGVITWNQKTLKFENGCRVKGFTMTASSSIGQTADFVYIDEFAYIPETIAQAFYKSIQPTLVSIDNSKMIITSTPNGLNLFNKLMTESELEPGDPNKNNFAGMRTYWHQVPNRNVSYIRLNQFRMAEVEVEYEDVYKFCKDNFDPNDDIDSNGLPLVTSKKSGTTGEMEIHIQNTEEVDIDVIRSIKIKNKRDEMIPIGVFSDLSSWKLDAMKNIGGEEAFNQEYDLRFINAAKSLFSESTMERINEGELNFKYQSHEVFDKLNWDYSNLKFIEDESIFHQRDRKWTKGIISVDVAEGLGADYSVINIFKISRKSDEVIEKFKSNYKSFDDFFQLEQIACFRDNLVSVKQLSEMLYLIAFEYFDEDNFKIVLELNNHGHAVKEAIKHVFDDDNNFGSHIFFRFKHRADSKDKSIGIKIGSNKNIMVREYQDRMKNSSVLLHEKRTLKEVSTFIKHQKSNGNITYKGDGNSNDDMVMTVVNMCSIFKDNIYKDMVDEYMRNLNDIQLKNKIDEVLMNAKSTDGTDYKSFLDTAKRAKKQKKGKSFCDR